MRIAVLLTVYNRREKTLACLGRLAMQVLPEQVKLAVYLTDDNSVDGTADAVARSYPNVNLLRGSGSLFWAGGMRNSWKAALKGNYDYYLLLNDDTLLRTDAISSLLSVAVHYAGIPSICVGATCDTTGKLTYGGRMLLSKYALKSKMVHSTRDVQDCDLGNANIMLVPAPVVSRLGILSDVFTHGIADYDYTLRARRAGFRVLVAPGFLGECENDHGRNWASAAMPLKKRIAFLKSPKGLAYHEYLYFIRSHFPYSLPATLLKLWLKTLFPGIWDSFKKVSY